MSASYDPREMPGGVDRELARLEAQIDVAWAEEARVLTELGATGAGRIVEVGCGSGALLARLAELAPGAALTGVDADPELLAHAARRAPDATLVAGDALALGLDDDSADVVLMRLVLQHIAEPVAALREARRVLAPGGTVAVIEVDGGMWGVADPQTPEVAPIQAKLWTAQSARGGDRFIARRLPRLLTAAGFADVRVRPYAYHSDALGRDAFAHVLDTAPYEAALQAGAITPAEYVTALRAHQRFAADPEALVMLLGFVVAGRA